MQIDQKDLKREYKERCVRKMPYFDRNLMKNSLIDFSEYTKSTTRREMPNKYHVSKVPKIEIEQVYHQNLLRKSKSISGSIPSAPMTPIEAPSSSQKPFYYTSNNEIMSIEEFLQVHKAMEGYRKKQDKMVFQQTMIEKRMKIEEAYSDRGSSCNTARRPSDAFLSTTGRPISTQISRKISGSQLMTPATARSPRENIVFEPTSFVPATPKTPKTAPGDATSKARKLRKGLSLKTNLELNMVAVDDTISTLRETTRIQPYSARGFTTNQKFTEKEITRHLFRGTVSPRPPRYGGKSVEKEKSYIRMFRDPKTMDLAIEATIRKATRLVTNEGQKSSRSKEQSPDRKNIEQFQSEETQLDNPPNFRNIAKKSETPIAPFSPRENIENEQPIIVEKMIRTSIKNISMALNSTTPRLLVGIFGDNDGSKTEKNKGRTKVLLRSEVEQKYNFSKHVEQNRRLSHQMKEITKALKKELPKSSMSNQNYIEHFTY